MDHCANHLPRCLLEYYQGVSTPEPEPRPPVVSLSLIGVNLITALSQGKVLEGRRNDKTKVRSESY